jgi:RNA 2',3'-cyclic 3'-phosphodiesterase
MVDAPRAAAMLRLFFALVPNAGVRGSLSALAGDVAHAAAGRPPHEENLHVTVAFLGDVPADGVPSVLEIGARAAANSEPFALVLNHLGMFRGSGIAWAAAQLIPPPLQRMFEALQEGLRASGLRVERRAFHPHVTLARHCTRSLTSVTMAPVTWPVSSLVLMASTTLPEGPRYAEIGSWGLAPVGEQPKRDTS